MTDVAEGRTESVDVDGAHVSYHDSITAVPGGRTLVLVLVRGDRRSSTSAVCSR